MAGESAKQTVKNDARDDRLSAPGLTSVRHRERNAIKKQMAADALDLCAEKRAVYVECARGRSFSIAWACRDVFKDFNDCLKLQCARVRPPHEPRARY